MFALAAIPAMFGQTFGDISGQVRDGSGANIPAVLITATNVASNVVRTATTNDVGLYSFPAMVPGAYDVKAEKAGFKTSVRTKVELQVQ